MRTGLSSGKRSRISSIELYFAMLSAAPADLNDGEAPALGACRGTKAVAPPERAAAVARHATIVFLMVSKTYRWCRLER